MNQVPKIQKIDEILKRKGIVQEMLEFSNALNKCTTEINNLFMQNRTLHETDIQTFKIMIADMLLHVDTARRHFGIKRDEIQKIYDKILELEYSKGENNE